MKYIYIALFFCTQFCILNTGTAQASTLKCLKSVVQLLGQPRLSRHDKKLKEYWGVRRENILNYNELTLKKVSAYRNHTEFEKDFNEMVTYFEKNDGRFSADLFKSWLIKNEKTSEFEFSRVWANEKDTTLGEFLHRKYVEYVPYIEQRNPFLRVKKATQDLVSHTKLSIKECKLNIKCIEGKVFEYARLRRESSCLFQNPNAISSLIRDYIFMYTALFVNQGYFMESERFPWDYALVSLITTASFVKANCEGVYRTRYLPGKIIDPSAPLKLSQRLKQQGYFKAFYKSEFVKKNVEDWSRLSFVGLWATALYVGAGEIQNYYQPTSKKMNPIERYTFLMFYSMSWAQFRSRFVFEPLKMKLLPKAIQMLKNAMGEATRAKKIFITSSDWILGMSARFGLGLYSNFEYLDILQEKIMPFLSYQVSIATKEVKENLNGLTQQTKEIIPEHLWVHTYWDRNDEFEPKVEVELSDELIEALLYEDLVLPLEE